MYDPMKLRKKSSTVKAAESGENPQAFNLLTNIEMSVISSPLLNCKIKKAFSQRSENAIYTQIL
jgi:hypothetical protein